MSYLKLSKELHILVESGDDVALAAFTSRLNDLQRAELRVTYQAFRGTDLVTDISRSLKNKIHAEVMSSLWKERSTNIIDTLQPLIRRKKKCPRVILSVLFGSAHGEWDELVKDWTTVCKGDLVPALKQAIQPSEFINLLIDNWITGSRTNRDQLRERAYLLKQCLHGEAQTVESNITETVDYEKLATTLATTSSTEWSTIVCIYEKLTGMSFDSIYLGNPKKSKEIYDARVMHMAAQFVRSIAEGVAYALSWAVQDKDISDICALTAIFVDRAPQTSIRYQKYGVLCDDLKALLSDRTAAPIIELWVPRI